MSSGLAPLRAVDGDVDVAEAIVGGEALAAEEDQARQLGLPHDPARPTKREIAEHCLSQPLVVFCLGVDVVCAVVLLANRRGLGQTKTANLAEKGFQRSVSIIVSLALRMAMMRRRGMAASSWCSLIGRRRLCMPLLLRRRHAGLGSLNMSVM